MKKHTKTLILFTFLKYSSGIVLDILYIITKFRLKIHHELSRIYNFVILGKFKKGVLHINNFLFKKSIDRMIIKEMFF